MFCFRKDTTLPKDFTPPLLVCGLDNAGKSTIISRIKSDPSDPIPTVGFVPTNVKVGNRNIKLYDVGGGSRIRGIWSSYFAEVYGVIYVIDATDISRLPETMEMFNSLRVNVHLQHKPLLILANKQDTNGALNATQINTKLDISTVENTLVVECSAIQPSLDKNVKNGLIWMLKYVTENYDELITKVSSDVAVIEEQRKKERTARQERIQKAREERELEDAKEKSMKGAESEEDDGIVSSPFKPIKQAFGTQSQEILSFPEPSQAGSAKKQKKLKKKKRKGNKITPFHSNEGSQKSLISNDSGEIISVSGNKLPPITTKKPLPSVDHEIMGLCKSSLSPIINNDSDPQVQKTKLEDLVNDSEPDASSHNNSVIIPGIFQNKYIDTESVSVKPVQHMKSFHSIRIDRSKFNQHIRTSC